MVSGPTLRIPTVPTLGLTAGSILETFGFIKFTRICKTVNPTRTWQVLLRLMRRLLRLRQLDMSLPVVLVIVIVRACHAPLWHVCPESWPA